MFSCRVTVLTAHAAISVVAVGFRWILIAWIVVGYKCKCFAILNHFVWSASIGWNGFICDLFDKWCFYIAIFVFTCINLDFRVSYKGVLYFLRRCLTRCYISPRLLYENTHKSVCRNKDARQRINLSVIFILWAFFVFPSINAIGIHIS